MIANYHTHTFRCHHASGIEREYIEAAVAAGFEEIGFSDHAPMPFDEGYYSGFRMRFDEFEDYCNTLVKLREEYRDRIKVRIGLESEYYPRLFPKLLQHLENTPVEYLILGQHFTDNETDGMFSGTATENPEHLTRYVNQVIEGMQTGCFTYVAHPDLFHFTGDRDFFGAELLRLCNRARELGIPMEVNFLGIWDHRHYPSVPYLDALAKSGCRVILGCDAHSADTAVQPQTEQLARKLLSERGIVPIDTVTLRHPIAGQRKS